MYLGRFCVTYSDKTKEPGEIGLLRQGIIAS